VAFYKDGVSDGTGTFSSGLSTRNANRTFGDSLSGILDEIRISNTARSADWITTEYNNQSATSTFYTMGAQTALDATAPTITSISSDHANGSFTVGEVIDIDVTFSEVVTSTGNVTITLETGVTDRTCTFTVSSSTTGTCNYTVQAGDTTSDLTVSDISATINDAASNAMTNFTPTTNLASNKDICFN
jgi:hypothetical protein